MLLVIALITFIGTQIMLSSMFPYSEVGSMLIIPASILSTAVLLFVYYWLIDNIPPLEKLSFPLGIITLVGIILVNVELHRQEGRPGVWEQLNSYVYVATNYNSITCDVINEPVQRSSRNMQPGQVERYVAALHRCREIIPLDGSYALYTVNKTNNAEFVIYDIDEIPQKLETGIERTFYQFLEWRYN